MEVRDKDIVIGRGDPLFGVAQGDKSSGVERFKEGKGESI